MRQIITYILSKLGWVNTTFVELGSTRYETQRKRLFRCKREMVSCRDLHKDINKSCQKITLPKINNHLKLSQEHGLPYTRLEINPLNYQGSPRSKLSVVLLQISTDRCPYLIHNMRCVSAYFVVVERNLYQFYWTSFYRKWHQILSYHRKYDPSRYSSEVDLYLCNDSIIDFIGITPMYVEVLQDVGKTGR